MEAYEFRAYEVLGYWTMVMIRVTTSPEGHVERELLYKGDHVPIDERDPHLRAALLLFQVTSDLEWTLANLASVPDAL